MSDSKSFPRLLMTVLLVSTAVASADVEVKQAWVRAMPPGSPATAAYFEVRNDTDSAITLVGASVTGVPRVEMHHTVAEGDQRRMEQLQQVAIPAGQTVSFQPGGKHLMLLDLAQQPAAGTATELCLQLASGAETCAIAEVGRDGPAAGDHSHHHH